MYVEVNKLDGKDKGRGEELEKKSERFTWTSFWVNLLMVPPQVSSLSFLIS